MTRLLKTHLYGVMVPLVHTDIGLMVSLAVLEIA